MEKKPLFHDSEFLKKLIPGKTMREYIVETGWAPTDFQLAALISHMNIPLKEKEAYWADIAKETEDQLLREQIKETLRRRKRAFDLFCEPGKYVFSLGMEDMEGEDERFEEEGGYFLTFEEALETGRQMHKPFRIRKHPLGPAQRRAIGGFNPFMGGDTPGKERVYFARFPWTGYMEYNAKGQAMLLEMLPDTDPEVTPGEALRRQYDPDRLERAYVPLPYPFRRGEIVAMLNWRSGEVEGYGLVWNTREDWEAYHQQERYRDYWDEAAIVEYIDDEDGDFTHSHINPFYLERGMPEDETTREYLLEGQQLLRGRGSMQGLFRARDAYRKARFGNAEEGQVWSM